LRLFSILLNGTSARPTSVPEKIEQNIQSLRAEHPFATHHLYHDEELRSFIAAHFGPEVTAAYDGMRPLAYRADLGRYCLLHVHGGLYSDLSSFFFAGLCTAAPTRLQIFRDYLNAVPWTVSNAIIAAPPGLPVFVHCIEAICHNVATRHYGINALCPTGPNLFGRMIASHVDPSTLENGHCVVVNPASGRYEGFAFVTQAGDLLAVRRKTSPGLRSLGLDTPNYGDLYDQRCIYTAETPPEPEPECEAQPQPQQSSAPLARYSRVARALVRGEPEYWSALGRVVARRSPFA
jgi:hypothetical protein